MPTHYCRVAPSLGSLEGTHQDVWGTKDYNEVIHRDKPTVFFGLYGLPDFYTLWRHRGKKWILWAGSDIRHFLNGYWLDEKGDLKISRNELAIWINKYCESWVENRVEQEALASVGIFSKICPSFMGNIEAYRLSFKPSDVPKLYASVSGDDFKLYGWDKIENIAKENPDIEFHLYGNTKEWVSKNPNVIVHGRVPKDVMNEEVKHMQGGLRVVTFDGFSEILAKSVLWGQWPVSFIEYPHILPLHKVRDVKKLELPNLQGVLHYKRELNNYPWVQR